MYSAVSPPPPLEIVRLSERGFRQIFSIQDIFAVNIKIIRVMITIMTLFINRLIKYIKLNTPNPPLFMPVFTSEIIRSLILRLIVF